MNNAGNKILDYLQGNLPAAEEKELFSAMAYDDGLRADFRSFTAIEKTLKSTAASFSVPGNVTENIMKGAGLAAKSASGAAGKGFLAGGKWFIVSGFSIMAFILGLLLNPVIFGDSKDADEQAANPEIPVSNNEEITEEYNLKSQKNNEIAAGVKDNYKSAKSTPLIDKTETKQTPSADADRNSSLTQSRQSASRHQEISASALRHVRAPVAPVEDMTGQNAAMPVLDFSQDKYQNNEDMNRSGLSLEFKGSIVNHFPEPEISPTRFSPLHNLSLGIMYDINEKFSIGIEAEQETFSLKYRGTGDDGINYTYYQQPNYTTFGLMMRYSPVKLAAMQPYARISGGINRGGYILKPSAGIEFNAYENLSFILGIEYNSFFYFHKENWFKTSKAAINYGISYKF